MAEAANRPEASVNDLQDWFLLSSLLNNKDELLRLSRLFAERGGRTERQYYMNQFYTRIREANDDENQQKEPTKPLSEEEFNFLLKCYEEEEAEIAKRGKDMPAGSEIHYSQGRAYILVAGELSGSFFRR